MTSNAHNEEEKFSTFNAKDGLSFTRVTGGVHHGSVHVNFSDGRAVVILTAEQWASVAASMSALGETGISYRMFEALQKG